jgi:hypothetical protein
MPGHHVDGHLRDMNNAPTNQASHGEESAPYEIRVQGHLAARWSAWFDGMTLTAQDDGTTVIHGVVADQSALQGLLRKLSDIGLPLISVTPTGSTEKWSTT